ncbi:MAG TPA: hypothetical protein VER96_22585 [Polyangiaceae bacterium]|nr:hypothetical protein [Polyangiaceae bacterium]
MYGIIALVAVRAVVYAMGKRGGQGGGGGPPTEYKPFVVRFTGYAVRAAFLVLAWALRRDLSIGWEISFVVWGAPSLVLELLLIPAGIPHLAYYFTRMMYPFAIFGEPRGRAVFNELRARLRWGWLLAPERIVELGRELVVFNQFGSDRAIGAATVAARAQLDALASNHEHARELFSAVQAMDWRHASRAARVYSQAWLLADAAHRGAFHEVVRLSLRGPYTGRRWFMGAAARRILGQSGLEQNWKLVGRWLFSPGKRQSFGFLRRALATTSWPASSPIEPGLPGAKRLSFELMQLPKGVPTRSDVARLARTWQTVLDSGELNQSLSERRQALNASFDVGAVAARFERQIVALLGELVAVTQPDSEPEEEYPLLLLAAMDRLHGDWFGELEDLCNSLLHNKAHVTNDLDKHWRTWARVRRLTGLLSDVLPERAAWIFSSVGGQLLNHGAWLYNNERAHTLAHEIFYYLLTITPKDDMNRGTIVKNFRLST